VLKLFFTDCQDHTCLCILCEKKKEMSRRDTPKHPGASRYNVPRPGENRSGNKT
jgi:hypothetical protein